MFIVFEVFFPLHCILHTFLSEQIKSKSKLHWTEGIPSLHLYGNCKDTKLSISYPAGYRAGKASVALFKAI